MVVKAEHYYVSKTKAFVFNEISRILMNTGKMFTFHRQYCTCDGILASKLILVLSIIALCLLLFCALKQLYEIDHADNHTLVATLPSNYTSSFGLVI